MPLSEFNLRDNKPKSVYSLIIVSISVYSFTVLLLFYAWQGGMTEKCMRLANIGLKMNKPSICQENLLMMSC